MAEQVVLDGPSTRNSSVSGRRPALLVTIIFAAGITVDHEWEAATWFWLLLGIGALAASISFQRLTHRGKLLSTLMLLIAVFAVGGLRHQVVWSTNTDSSLSTLISTEPTAVEIEGTLGTSVEFLDRPIGPRIPPWMEIDRSVCTLVCERLVDNGSTIPISGLVRMEVAGHLVNVTVGDRVKVLGQLMLPAQPKNPGEFDFGKLLRTRGISARLAVTHPAAVQKIGQASGLSWTISRWRTAVRQECRRLLTAELRPPYTGLAASLLLGDRTGLIEEMKEQFMETGMMHLLAISGINVGIFLGVVFCFGRVLNIQARTLAVAMIIATGLFLWIADHQPSVTRAGVMAVIGLSSIFFHRRPDGWNVLATCAGVLLLWNPLDLFDIGAQFSFLAVGAIIWTSRTQVWQLWKNRAAVLPEISPARQMVERTCCAIVQMYLVTGAIWLATLPVSMATFHIVTPIGLLLDLLLIPVATISLGLGYLFLTIGLLSPWLASWIAIPFGWGLQLMHAATAWGQRVPGGHFFVPSLACWWLAGFYVLLALTWIRTPAAGRHRWPARLWGAWIVLGLLLPVLPQARHPFRCTFLSVGHGLACVVQLPSGETVLYDAGTLGDGRIAQRAVENLLWSRGIDHLDLVILSHADHDHFSGLFDLFDRFPVREMCLSQQSARSTQPAVLELQQAAFQHRIPMTVLQHGDELRCGNGDDAVTATVLHPTGIADRVSDNSQSLTLMVTVGGRNILLTGDLEQPGLDTLLRQAPIRCDVLLSPHHGGKASNIQELFEWAQPEYVVVSARHADLPHLKRPQHLNRLLNTATSGAITFTIQADGQIAVEEFLTSLKATSDRDNTREIQHGGAETRRNQENQQNGSLVQRR